MKVAIIGQMLNKNYSNRISGGIQTVERLHVRIFLEAGWEVFFIASKESENFNDKVKFCLTDTLSLESAGDNLTRAEKSANSKKSSKEIRSLISEIQPDLIINHSFSSSHTRLTADLSEKIPSLGFVHNLPDTAMDIGVIAKVQHYLSMTKSGGALVCVSEYQRNLWRTALRKRISSGGDSFNFLDESMIDVIYDKFYYPIYVEKQEVQANDKYFISISRPDPIKNVSKLLELLKDLDYKLHLFLAHPGALTDNEYYNEKIKPYLTSNVEVHHNAPRQDLLDCLSNAAGCFIPCTVEAAPVALLEAGSYGVPSIVFAKERNGQVDHAANYLLGRDNVTLVNISDKEDLSKRFDEVIKKVSLTSLDDRIKLRDITYTKHSLKNRYDDLLKISKDIMDKYTTKKSLLQFN